METSVAKLERMPVPRETRIQIESTTMNPSILVLNTPYLYKNKYGIIKTIIFAFSLVLMILLLMYSKQTQFARFFYLSLVTFCHLYIITIMIICCLFSLTTATLLSKIIFDYVFHAMGCITYLIAGIWIIVQDIQTDPSYQYEAKPLANTFCVLTFILSILHLAHSVLSYRSHIA